MYIYDFTQENYIITPLTALKRYQWLLIKGLLVVNISNGFFNQDIRCGYRALRSNGQNGPGFCLVAPRRDWPRQNIPLLISASLSGPPLSPTLSPPMGSWIELAIQSISRFDVEVLAIVATVYRHVTSFRLSSATVSPPTLGPAG